MILPDPDEADPPAGQLTRDSPRAAPLFGVVSDQLSAISPDNDFESVGQVKRRSTVLREGHRLISIFERRPGFILSLVPCLLPL